MNLITLENINKSYGEKNLFDNISFNINEGEKIGLIGVNGTGKSTLLSIIAGDEICDSGSIIKSTSLTLEYLKQNPDFEDELTVLQQVFTGDSPGIKLVREYEEAIALAQKGDKEIDKRIIALTQKMDEEGTWEIESEAKIILTILGITDFSAKIKTLSGGQKKRVALAMSLINPCDLLILDEPTNHMDNDSIDWLELYLKKSKKSLLMVTHDRYFLDRVVNKTLELEEGKLYTYLGNYSCFLQKKIEREEQLQSSERKWQKLYENELAWIKRGAKARTTKQKARIDRFNNLVSDKVETDKEKLEIVTGGSRLGKKIIELDDISKNFSDKIILNKFNYILLRRDRVGIIGPNGSGKSTLLNMIAGRIKPDKGTIDIGETVKIGYFSQEAEGLNQKLRVIEYIREEAEFLTVGDGRQISASQLLETFLFNGEMQWTYISRLSGGEKRRLYLLRIIMSSPNILILDEPTNDLDIETLTVLEDYIQNFNGAVIAVSHDRYFLDRVAEKIFAFEGDGIIRQYTGNYSGYMELHKEEEEDREKNKPLATKVKEETKQDTRSKKLKFTFREQKEFEVIDSQIEESEKKLKSLENNINAGGSDFQLLNTLLSEKQALQLELEKQYERWEYLNDLAEKIVKLD